MNAVPNSEISFTQENAGGSSDTDTIPDDDSPDYYEPISNADDDQDSDHSDGCLENGITYLDLTNQEQEEERMREAVQRAFRDDESRRRAPLTQENALRVMEAMRGISLPGLPPDWAAEDRWMDELERIRQPPRSSS